MILNKNTKINYIKVDYYLREIISKKRIKEVISKFEYDTKQDILNIGMLKTGKFQYPKEDKILLFSEKQLEIITPITDNSYKTKSFNLSTLNKFNIYFFEPEIIIPFSYYNSKKKLKENYFAMNNKFLENYLNKPFNWEFKFDNSRENKFYSKKIRVTSELEKELLNKYK